METFSFRGNVKSRIVWRYPHVLSVEKPGEERKTTFSGVIMVIAARAPSQKNLTQVLEGESLSEGEEVKQTLVTLRCFSWHMICVPLGRRETDLRDKWLAV